MNTIYPARMWWRWLIASILPIAFLRMLDLLSFTDLGPAVLSPGGSTFSHRLAAGSLLIVYSLFFAWVSLFIVFVVYSLLFRVWIGSIRKTMPAQEVIRSWVIFLLLLLVVYYGWLGWGRIRGVTLLPDIWLIVWIAFLAAIGLYGAFRIRRIADPGRLKDVGVAGLWALVLARLVYFGLDTAFLNPLTRSRLPLAGLGLVLSLAVGLFACWRFLGYLKRRARFVLVFRLSTLFTALVTFVSLVGMARESRELLRPLPALPAGSAERPNVILVVIDALRADHLSAYGYHRRTSPRLDRLAEEGIRFAECYAPASWTKPSVASLLTGLLPAAHGTLTHTVPLPAAVATIAETLQNQGYLTAAIITNPFLKNGLGFDQGFDLYDDSLVCSRLYELALRHCLLFPLLRTITKKNFDLTDRDGASRVNRKVYHYLDQLAGGSFFLYLHYMDPHAPYDPPGPYRDLFPSSPGDRASELTALYDGEIRFADDQIGKLLGALVDRGLYDRTLLVITSDHGEAFGERGDFGHGHTIYQNQVLVPLIVRHPALAAGVVLPGPVRLIDLAPTILDFLDSADGEKVDGRSLIPWMKNPGSAWRREEIFIDHKNFDGSFVISGLISEDGWKYIRNQRSPLIDLSPGGVEELYNLAADPGETRNLAGQRPDILDLLGEKCRRHLEQAGEKQPQVNPIRQDRETIRQLRSLGYM